MNLAKKLVAVVAALALVCCLGISAFAADASVVSVALSYDEEAGQVTAVVSIDIADEITGVSFRLTNDESECVYNSHSVNTTMYAYGVSMADAGLVVENTNVFSAGAVASGTISYDGTLDLWTIVYDVVEGAESVTLTLSDIGGADDSDVIEAAAETITISLVAEADTEADTEAETQTEAEVEVESEAAAETTTVAAEETETVVTTGDAAAASIAAIAAVSALAAAAFVVTKKH